MRNGNIEYKGRTYSVNHHLHKDTLGEDYHTIDFYAGRKGISVTGKTLEKAVTAFKQAIDEREAKKRKVYK